MSVLKNKQKNYFNFKAIIISAVSVGLVLIEVLNAQGITLPQSLNQTTSIMPLEAVLSPRIDELTNTKSQLSESYDLTLNNSNFTSGAGYFIGSNNTVNLQGYPKFGTLQSNTLTNIVSLVGPIASGGYTANNKGGTGALAFAQQVDMTKSWSMSGVFDLTNINHAASNFFDSSYGPGDFLGLVMSPVAPNQLGTGYGAGGLGIQNLPNSYAWGFDFWANYSSPGSAASTFIDDQGVSHTFQTGDAESINGRDLGMPQQGAYSNQVVGFRYTDATGQLNQLPQDVVDNTQHILTYIGGNQGANTSSWLPNNGGNSWAPNLFMPFSIDYTYDAASYTGTITAQMSKGTWDNPNSTADSQMTWTQTIPLTSPSMSIGFSGTAGAKTNSQTGVELDSFIMELGTGQTIVHYQDQFGNTLINDTRFLAKTTDIIGITGFDANGPTSNNQANLTYTLPAPTSADRQELQGYHLAKAAPVTVGGDIQSGATVTEGNEMTLQYQGDTQSASLKATMTTADVAVPVTIPSSDSNATGASNTPISFTTTDATLTKAGYSYTVTGPDGNSYQSLDLAINNNSNYNNDTTWDSTLPDPNIQNFTVVYTANPVTLTYGILDTTTGNIDTTNSEAIKSLDSISDLTIGKVLDSELSDAVSTAADDATTNLQALNILPKGYHLTGKIDWSKDNGATKISGLPKNALSADDVSLTNQAMIIYEITKDFQQAEVKIAYEGNAENKPSDIDSIQTGKTGDAFTFDLTGVIAGGYHLTKAEVPANTPALTLPLSSISGTYDNTNNLSQQSDKAIQLYQLTASPDIQTLTVTYSFPQSHELSATLTTSQKIQKSMTGEVFQDFEIPKITGYTPQVRLPDGTIQTATTITGILADNTSNGSNTTDSVPQVVAVSYVAEERQITINYHTPDNQIHDNDSFPTTISGVNYVTDGTYSTIAIESFTGYTTMVSINGSTPQPMTSVPSGVFGTNNIQIDVTYDKWQAQVNYYTQIVDSNGVALGGINSLPDKNASKTGDEGTDFSSVYSSTTQAQTDSLQAMNAISEGFYVKAVYWSVKPDGSTNDESPPYQQWTWDDFTNMADGLVPNYQAAIVYQVARDTQTANVTVTGVPDGTSSIANGTSSYTGETARTQVVDVPKIHGYIVTIYDAAGNVINNINNQFTITYDQTNNYGQADVEPQNYTIAYTARTPNILINSVYADNVNATIMATPSVDTVAYATPSLPKAIQITAESGDSYSLKPQEILGYTWTMTGTDGSRYTSSNLPTSLVSDGTTLTYTVTYAPVDAVHLINYKEAIYDNNGKMSFTTNDISGLGKQTFTGKVGEIQDFSVTSTNINVPKGWTLDPMKASLTNFTDSVGQADGFGLGVISDNLNGSNPAKRLTFVPGTVDYIVYLARDIQSVQVQFVNDPDSKSTLFYDGRTGLSYEVDVQSFIKSGYDYTITNPDGQVVSEINGTYDNTSNGNAGSAIYNNGDSDSQAQVYTVTYQAQKQTAILKTDQSDPDNPSGITIETVTGNTASAIGFAKDDLALEIDGYNYTITVSYTNDNDEAVSINYPSLSQAIAANPNFNHNNVASGQTDTNPQIFTVSYTPCLQTAILKTDATDPKGEQLLETVNGLSAGEIQLTQTDNGLKRTGYSYTVTGPDKKVYSTLQEALSANSSYDKTDNATAQIDAKPQTFVVSYIANTLNVAIDYRYGSPKNSEVPPTDLPQNTVTKITGTTNGTTYTTNINSTPEPATNSIMVPTIKGYTPNVTSVTPQFTVDSLGNPTQPVITVTYAATPQNATIAYQDIDGNSLTAYIGDNPTSASGYTDAVILNTAPKALPGYTLTGFTFNNITKDIADITSVVYTSDQNSLVLIYTPNSDNQVKINYLYSTADFSQKNGTVPVGDFTSPPTSAVTGTTNTTGEPIEVPAIAGYTADVTKVTPDFSINAGGQLLYPEINVTYTANNQNATIAYKLAAVDSDGQPDYENLSDMNPSLLNGAPLIATGVTDQPINVATPKIPGYQMVRELVNDVIQEPITASFTQPDNLDDQIEIVYIPNGQVATVHYVFQLPDEYDGNYDGNQLTSADNGKAVSEVIPDIPSSLQDQKVFGHTAGDATPVSASGEVISGWQVTPMNQDISWAINADGMLTKSDYYFYVSPVENTVTIKYQTADGTDLLPQILEENADPILTTQVLSGENFLTSGAIAIPGYTFINAKYNGQAYTGDNKNVSYQSEQNEFVFNYEANEQVVTIDYQYDPNNALIGSSKTGKVTSDNTTGWNPTNAQLAQTKQTNATGEEITVPEIPGYTASATTVTPSFAVDSSTGELVQPTITITYTANQNNVADIRYLDTSGNDISKYASIPVAQKASGTTDQLIPTSGAVVIPGYSFEKVTFQAANQNVASEVDPSALIFSGAGIEKPDTVAYIYSPDEQVVNVHYLYANGALKGQDILERLTIDGHSNDPAETTEAKEAPIGYEIVKAGLDGSNQQPVMWTIVNGYLVTPDIYFYYQAQVTSATVNYATAQDNNDLNSYVPSDTITGVVQGVTDDIIPTKGAVPINGYTFSGLYLNDNAVPVAKTEDEANKAQFSFTPTEKLNEKTTLTYVYSANTQRVIVKFVDEKGNSLVGAAGEAIPDMTIDGLSNGAIDYTPVNSQKNSFAGYTLLTDDTETTTKFDANDSVDQIVYLTYEQQTQSVTVKYVDQKNLALLDANGNKVREDVVINGYTNDLIDYDAIKLFVPGYTLVSDGTNTTTRFDTSGTSQTVYLKYQPNPQQAVVNFLVAKNDTTWVTLVQSNTLTGVSNGVIDYDNITKDYPGYCLVNDETNSVLNYDALDTKQQVINLYYAPYQQVAILQTDATDPDNESGSVVATTDSGYSFGTLAFLKGADNITTVRDEVLVRKGFTYKVYGPDKVWYDSFAQALAANGKYDGNKTSKTIAYPTAKRILEARVATIPIDPLPLDTSIDDEPQVFIASYTPMVQSMVVETKNDPAGNRVFPAITGVTGINSNGTPIPEGARDYQDTMQLPKISNLADFYNINAVDTQAQTTITNLPNLYRSGYIYQVIAPNGETYSTIQAATNAVHVFDNDENSNQIFTVNYIPQLQSVTIKTDATDPKYKGGKTLEIARGLSDSEIVINTDDSNLKRSGYIYTVKTPDNRIYPTLAEALAQYALYDHSEISATGIDLTPQNFVISYQALPQPPQTDNAQPKSDSQSVNQNSVLPNNSDDNNWLMLLIGCIISMMAISSYRKKKV